MQGDYAYYEKMYVLEELLKEDGFVRCHQSYIVSKRYVTGYNSAEIELDRLTIPIGRKYKNIVHEAFSDEPVAMQEEVECAVTEKQGVLVGVKGACKGVSIEFYKKRCFVKKKD